MKKPVACDPVIPKRTAMISNASTEDKLFLFVFMDTKNFFSLYYLRLEQDIAPYLKLS